MVLKNIAKSLLAALAVCLSVGAAAQLYPAVPPNVASANNLPLVMLTMSRDHLYFYRAYDEYSDLNGDGLPDSGYTHGIDYYGYFDSYKCYTYDNVSKVFKPASLTSNKFCSGAWSGNFLNWLTMTRMDVVRKVLYGGRRVVDSAQTVLERANLPTDAHSFAKYYDGGQLSQLTPFSAPTTSPYRAVNGNNDNAHYLVFDNTRNKKYVYAGAAPTGAPFDNLADPADANNCQVITEIFYDDTVPTRPLRRAPPKYHCVWFNGGSSFDTAFKPEVGDQIVATAGQSQAGRVSGVVVHVDSNKNFTLVVTPEGFVSNETSTPAAQTDWLFEIPSQVGMTFCNTTLGDSSPSDPGYYSQTNPGAPIFRVARGNFQLWSASRGVQCAWSNEGPKLPDSARYYSGNNISVSGLAASYTSPDRNTRRIGFGADDDFVVRVVACEGNLVGKERCRQYPDGTFKPIGLLQEFGEPNLAEFALMTTSYDKNKSGGVLRSNAGSFRNEVSYATNGTFSLAQGIVYNLDRLRIFGYRYGDGSQVNVDRTYADDAACSFQLTSLSNGQCSSWGNPVGEMYVEALRYLAGKTVDPFFDTTGSSRENTLALSRPVWIDPFKRGQANYDAYGVPQCRPINIFNFNASVTSYDGDELGKFNEIASINLDQITDKIGQEEKINNTRRFIGALSSAPASADAKICSDKLVDKLSNVRGLCPDGPGTEGSYSVAGAAYWARTNRIRDDLPFVKLDDQDRLDDFRYGLKVNTFAVSLSPGKPVITIKNPKNPQQSISLQPAYLLDKGSGRSSGTLVDFKVMSQDATQGSYLLVWDDSQQGGDYEQDVTGILRYKVTSDGLLHVYTRTLNASTSNPQGFGYVISGAGASDGAQFHSGIVGFSYDKNAPPLSVSIQNPDGSTATFAEINAKGNCGNCNLGDPETGATYAFGASGVEPLQDPLWYAAKWGGFSDKSELGQINADTGASTAMPDSINTWDVQTLVNSSSTFSITAGSDNVPDNYFQATRADALEGIMRAALSKALSYSNNSPAFSSSSIAENSFKYVTRFSGVDGHGELEAFKADKFGAFAEVPSWKAQDALAKLGKSKRVITNTSASAATLLEWGNLDTATKTSAFGGTDAAAQARLDWVLGDRNNESPKGYRFRARNPDSLMGSIINSNPHVQDRPHAAYLGSNFPGYLAFRKQYNPDDLSGARPRVVWVGANDGMLYGFDEETGNHVLSFLPKELLASAASWALPSSPTLIPMMDGTPFTGDVQINSNWATYLFAPLGRGGRGVYALDVTDTKALPSAAPSQVFKWAFTAKDDQGVTGKDDLGYILSDGNSGINPASFQPGQIARMANGQFAVLFGNGYQSPGGRAVLYILFVDGPNNMASQEDQRWTGRYVKLVVDEGPNNGLSQPTWIDPDNDGIADYIYAGDLHGNLWKFDVTSSEPTDWVKNVTEKKILGGYPLFTTKASAAFPEVATAVPDRFKDLSITMAPRYNYHPFGGPVISFATGRAVTATDFPDTAHTHAIFGIWDNPDYVKLTPTELHTELPNSVNDLSTRSFVTTAAPQGTVSYVAGEGIDWGKPKVNKGWFLPFPLPGEASMYNPAKIDDLIAVTSIIPTALTPDPVATAPETCNRAPTGFVTFINPVTGLLDANLAGTVDVVGGPDGNTVTQYMVNRFEVSGKPAFGLCTGPSCTVLATCTGQDCNPSNPAVCSKPGGDCNIQTCKGGACRECPAPQRKLQFATAAGDRSLCLVKYAERLSWREVPTFKTAE